MQVGYLKNFSTYSIQPPRRVRLVVRTYHTKELQLLVSERSIITPKTTVYKTCIPSRLAFSGKSREAPRGRLNE